MTLCCLHSQWEAPLGEGLGNILRADLDFLVPSTYEARWELTHTGDQAQLLCLQGVRHLRKGPDRNTGHLN